MTQLALLPTPPKASSKPVLAVEPVPARISLGDRYFLVAKQGDRRWFFPLQFTAIEAHWLLSRLQGCDWSLDSTGVPLDLPRIRMLIECAIDSRLVGGGK